MHTAFVHCTGGGVALFAPDYVRETFEPSTEHGGTDNEGKGMRYLEWTYDPHPDDTLYTTEYVYVLRENNQEVHVESEQHICGLFKRAEWIHLVETVGFQPEIIQDMYERDLFVAHKPK